MHVIKLPKARLKPSKRLDVAVPSTHQGQKQCFCLLHRLANLIIHEPVNMKESWTCFSIEEYLAQSWVLFHSHLTHFLFFFFFFWIEKLDFIKITNVFYQNKNFKGKKQTTEWAKLYVTPVTDKRHEHVWGNKLRRDFNIVQRAYFSV